MSRIASARWHRGLLGAVVNRFSRFSYPVRRFKEEN